MDIAAQIAILVLGGYLIGSVPSAYLAARFLKGKNLLAIGTGSATATAAFLHVSKLAGILGFLGEVAKGLACLYVGHVVVGEVWGYLMVIVFGIVGANWSIWLRGGGGRGQTMLIVAVAALSPLALPFLGIVFGAAIAITRRMYLSTHIFNLSLPVVLGLVNMSWVFAAAGAALTIVFLIKQRKENDDLVQSGKLGTLSR